MRPRALQPERCAQSVATRHEANVMLATGNSQLAFLDELVQVNGIDWPAVRAFHMDEYVGLSPTPHARASSATCASASPPGSRSRSSTTSPATPATWTPKRGVTSRCCARIPLDLCCAGIGENGHLAFNDPPVADFDDPRDVKVVALEPKSREQQVGEGHFATLARGADAGDHRHDPRAAARAARARDRAGGPQGPAVRDALHGPLSTACPASTLRRRPNATLYLDAESSALVV